MARYRTAEALGMAVKSAARKSPLDTSMAIRGFYYDRFLCRVFSEDEPAFILKGGQGMLARTTSARSTTDVDLLYRKTDINEAVERLKRIAAIELGDYMEFRFKSIAPIAEAQEYREGFRITFEAVLGVRKVDDVSVDLVTDRVACENPDVIASESRLDIEGLATFDYLVYPVEYMIVDKICATMGGYADGSPSSRVKDLVDLVTILSTQTFESTVLAEKLVEEFTFARKLGEYTRFKVPALWLEQYTTNYQKLARKVHLVQRFESIGEAEELVQACLAEALTIGESTWNPEKLIWVSQEGR